MCRHRRPAFGLCSPWRAEPKRRAFCFSPTRTACPSALRLLGGDSSRLICAISAEGDKGGDAYLKNINTARSFHAMGQATWYSDEVMDEIKALKRGPYREAAQAPFSK